ncbi:MAG TPA: type II toxin-antitoxin system RelE/ParE family toxin [Gammaproteobacteria bacterium]|nr:type II toxin-antitoxin system RelE/ParE family toxin [Gammaproteobacteria bacterium]
MKIIWSPLAVEQVQDIAAYIALDKPSVAIEWAEKIFNSVNQLIEFPDSGRIVPEIKRKEIRELVLKNHRIIYKVKSKEILILVVKYYHQILKKDDVKV